MIELSDSFVERVVWAVRETARILTDPSAVQTIKSKKKTDFVTNVDTAVQESLRIQLTGWAPEIQFMSEEKDNSALDDTRPFWILDPVDGTTNLIHGVRHSAISLALTDAGQIIFGVVYDPYREECFTAQYGMGAFCNGRPLRVSQTSSIQDSLLSVGTVPGQREMADAAFQQIRALYDNCQDIRRTGCASLDLCWVACGRLDGFSELALQPWDYAAGMLLVGEAGGQVTTLEGTRPSLLHGGPLLASNGLIHDALRSILA